MKKDYLEVILEEMNSKFDLVLEGNKDLRNEIQMTRTELKKDIEFCNFKIDALNDKIDAVDKRLGKRIDAVEHNLGNKIDAVATDLAAHRTDTEAHHNVYCVKEG